MAGPTDVKESTEDKTQVGYEEEDMFEEFGSAG
jgi:hypothetical protein